MHLKCENPVSFMMMRLCYIYLFIHLFHVVAVVVAIVVRWFIRIVSIVRVPFVWLAGLFHCQL